MEMANAVAGLYSSIVYPSFIQQTLFQVFLLYDTIRFLQFSYTLIELNTQWGWMVWMSGWEETHLIPPGGLMSQKQAWG